MLHLEYCSPKVYEPSILALLGIQTNEVLFEVHGAFESVEVAAQPTFTAFVSDTDHIIGDTATLPIESLRRLKPC